MEGPIAIVLLRRKCYRYIIEEGANIEEQIRTLREYQKQLAILGNQIEDQDFTMTLLKSSLRNRTEARSRGL